MKPEYLTFLSQPRQSRTLAKACLAEAGTYKSRCQYWLAMAHKAQSPPLL